MAAASHRTDLFTNDAVAVIHGLTKGIGLHFNALCNQYLFAGAIEKVSQIDDQLV
jgi:hypothetical protein